MFTIFSRLREQAMRNGAMTKRNCGRLPMSAENIELTEASGAAFL
jgi:hypothetical protein